jgi:hypothetical protein
MKQPSLLVNILKVLLLTVVTFVLFAVIYPMVGVGENLPEPPGDPAQTAMILLGNCFIQSAVLSILIWRARWSGLRLALGIALAWVLGAAVLSQMDTLWFMPQMGVEFVLKILMATTLQATIFSLLAVWILGKWRQQHQVESPRMEASTWVKAFAVLALLHIVLYFTCGYYIAWQSEELRAFYGGEDPGSFFAQMKSLLDGDPWLFAFQFLRGVLWALVAALLYLMLTGSRVSVAMISASFIIAFFSLMLALPNPVMPDAIRHAHLIETVVSRGLFAFIAICYLDFLIRPRHAGQA